MESMISVLFILVLRLGAPIYCGLRAEVEQKCSGMGNFGTFSAYYFNHHYFLFESTNQMACRLGLFECELRINFLT